MKKLYSKTKTIFGTVLIFLILPIATAQSANESRSQLLTGDQSEGIEYGLATQYPEDVGIRNHPSVIFASGIETESWYMTDFGYTGWPGDRGFYITDPNLVLSGNGVLEYRNIEGEHLPYVYDIDFEEGVDVIFLRWYRRYEAGYDFSCQSKTNGVYALIPGGSSGGGAGVKPTGFDKYSLKLQMWNGNGGGEPKFYTYHPDQVDIYGDTLPQNIGEPAILQPDRWYSFEIMLKANDAGIRNGEIKLWIDGILKGHYTGMRFRDTNDLKINQLNLAAYMGGSCIAPKNQKLWDDNIVLATQYIGPMVKPQDIDPSDQIIIDNIDSRFSATHSQDAWQTYENADGQHYGNTHHYNQEIGTGQDSATWSFTVSNSGNYDVYAWWWEGSWRPPDVPYTINHFEGTSTVRADQRVNGGQWNLLGSYYFESKGSVIVSDDVSSGRDIVADAIRLVYRSENPPPETTSTPEPSTTPTTEPDAISLILDSPSSIVPGDTINMDVIARNIPYPGLYGVQFEINYDPNLVSVSNVQVNPNLTFVVENKVDNPIGKIKFAASQRRKVPGLIGDINLLSFNATAANTSGQIIFSFQDEKISDDQAQSIMVISQQYGILIDNNGVTPEPTTQPTIEPQPTITVMPPTSEPTVYPTPEPTNEPTSTVISGQIILTGRNNDNWSDAIVSIGYGGLTSSTNVNGIFRITDLPAELLGNITVEAPGYLPAVCNEITSIASSIALNPIALLSGDINDDNLVDIVDATAVGTDFGQTGINSPVDITRDNIIDIFDIVLVSVNFGEIGPTEWNCVTN